MKTDRNLKKKRAAMKVTHLGVVKAEEKRDGQSLTVTGQVAA